RSRVLRSLHSYGADRYLHSFPTRRSSDLLVLGLEDPKKAMGRKRLYGIQENPEAIDSLKRMMSQRITPRLSPPDTAHEPKFHEIDRKSTRLNSSHVAISYAVFCLKKKTHE